MVLKHRVKNDPSTYKHPPHESLPLVLVHRDLVGFGMSGTRPKHSGEVDRRVPGETTVDGLCGNVQFAVARHASNAG